jgi:hypothetical protein
VVVQQFVEYALEGQAERWDHAPSYGHRLPVHQDPTTELIALARTQDVLDVLGEMRLAGIPVTRWALWSAPRRIELDSGAGRASGVPNGWMSQPLARLAP